MSRAKDMRFPELDALRGFAVFYVLALHLWQLSWYSPPIHWGGHPIGFHSIFRTGYLGVPIFLMLSGLCLYLPIAREPSLLDDRSWLFPYFVRRMAKILPSYYFAILVCACVTPGQFGGWKDWLFQIGTHVTFTHNFFRATVMSLYGVFWSLATEAQFYLIFPFLALAMRRRPYSTAFGMAVTGLAYRFWALKTFPGEFFPLAQLPGYFDVYGLGLLAAHWMIRPPASLGRAPGWSTFLAGIGALLIPAVMNWATHYPKGIQHLPFYGLLLFCFPFALFATASPYAARWFRWLAAPKVLSFLGAISFNLYLWHQELGRKMYAAHWPAALTKVPHDDPVWRSSQFWLSTSLSVLLALFLTYQLERPILEWTARWLEKRKGLTSGRRIYRWPRPEPSQSPARKPSARRRARG